MVTTPETDPWAGANPSLQQASPGAQHSDAASEASDYFEDAEVEGGANQGHHLDAPVSTSESPSLEEPLPEDDTSATTRGSGDPSSTPPTPTLADQVPAKHSSPSARTSAGTYTDPTEAEKGSNGTRSARTSLATTVWRASLQSPSLVEELADMKIIGPNPSDSGQAVGKVNGASENLHSSASATSPASHPAERTTGDRSSGDFAAEDGDVPSAQPQRWRKSIQELREASQAQADSGDGPLVDWDFWGAVMNDYEEVARTRPRELSKAIQAGIPPALRGMMWQLMSSSKDPDLESIYSHLLGQPSVHEKAISRDLGRTFPQHEYFQHGGGVGQDSLMAVCKAYSLYDEEVGYTQGLQFIVGPLLLNMPDEEAFCVLVRLMKSYDLRSHFTPNMPGLQLRLFQFDRLLEELLPHVFMHLMRQGIKSSMYASQWFLTLFGYRFPLDLVSVVMDLVFAEGVEAVFRFSLALMKKNEQKICSLDFDALLDFLKLDLFEVYKEELASEATHMSVTPRPRYRASEFVREALQVKITPVMLDQYAAEWDAMCRQQNAHTLELEALRQANSKLSGQVRRLEASLAQINEEHCDLVKQVVMAKLEREELEEELVKFKLAFAEMSHRHATSEATRHRNSITTSTS